MSRVLVSSLFSAQARAMEEVEGMDEGSKDAGTGWSVFGVSIASIFFLESCSYSTRSVSLVMVEIESITDVEDNWESCKEEGSNAECKEGGSDVVVINTRKEVPKTLGQAGTPLELQLGLIQQTSSQSQASLRSFLLQR